MKKRSLTIGLVSTVLVGCATPQERAIRNYCELEAYKSIPERLETRKVYRDVYVGEKVVGNKEKCKTEVKQKRKSDGTLVVEQERTCKDEPITEAAYESRLVEEVVDLSAGVRGNFVKRCSQDALLKNMFNNL